VQILESDRANQARKTLAAKTGSCDFVESQR
jgi:hypothetical protein